MRRTFIGKEDVIHLCVRTSCETDEEWKSSLASLYQFLVSASVEYQKYHVPELFSLHFFFSFLFYILRFRFLALSSFYFFFDNFFLLVERCPTRGGKLIAGSLLFIIALFRCPFNELYPADSLQVSYDASKLFAKLCACNAPGPDFATETKQFIEVCRELKNC